MLLLTVYVDSVMHYCEAPKGHFQKLLWHILLSTAFQQHFMPYFFLQLLDTLYIPIQSTEGKLKITLVWLKSEIKFLVNHWLHNIIV